METIAKVFMHGNSQAVRLPKKFRFDTDEVHLRKDMLTGELTMRPLNRQEATARFLAALKKLPIGSDDWLPPRSQEVRPDPFADWEAP